MESISGTFSIISKGGIIMLPIIALSLYVFYVILLKILEYRKLGVYQSDFSSDVIANLQNEKISEAERSLQESSSPLAITMLRAIKLLHYRKLSNSRIEPEIERTGMIELEKMKSKLKSLEVVAAIAPLLGLLGTVIGMVKAFAKLAENTTRIDPSILAGGIWEALITTVAGLLVAIPAFIAYYYFTGKVEAMRLLMKDAVTQILNLQEDESEKPLTEISARVLRIENDIYEPEEDA